MHVQKGTSVSEALRTQFKDAKPQNFLETFPQTPLEQSLLWALLFVFALRPSHPLGGPADGSMTPNFSGTLKLAFE